MSKALEGGPFTVRFDSAPQRSLDERALQARQDHNFGNTDRWFDAFRGGHYGMYARLNGVTERYAEFHAWRYQPRHPRGWNTPLGELFFNADSALECFVFGLNALGHGVGGTGFRNTMSESELRRVTPKDPIGGKIPGCADIFPQFSAALERGWDEWVQPVVDQHDVAKHREQTHKGGRLRNDPPTGFWERVGLLDEKDPRRFLFMPYAEVKLMPDPKRLRQDGESPAHEDMIKLEELIPGFAAFFDGLVQCALDDVTDTVPLTDPPPG